ncbi:hypothetical protein [Vibrio anguillarum]|nr:hypothetical protein [Vibrio anguillarum]AXN05135.1 hypothetical protein DD610_13150 [Vibrio anguillarum]MBF4218018.1 hypothetical protein [Vibrio anguillarum]MBF4232031.1 hypothetical protein [Vibrio anguillarum]MBF4251534.1 hypothetical protein [Vibrio anguillarum]MBF4284108.1 hypothetical protein [Vibrio anguillarum]
MTFDTQVYQSAIHTIKSARKVADYAQAQGISQINNNSRPTYEHMGAVLADSILQAGLNYSTVVKPRIDVILNTHEDKKTVFDLVVLVENDTVSEFLNWSHNTKISRFKNLVLFMYNNDVNTSVDLKDRLSTAVFCSELQSLTGIGPKTVDYMKCLVGIDSIAVDRHIRTFAQNAGVEHTDYDFLRDVFCSAADLLSISRRNFDSWIWTTLSKSQSPQQELLLF